MKAIGINNGKKRAKGPGTMRVRGIGGGRVEIRKECLATEENHPCTVS